MTCYSFGGAIVCRPTRAIKRLFARCPKCKRLTRGLFYDEGYYGVQWLYLCGHTFAEDGMWPLYQGPVHRRQTEAEVRAGWKAKLPSWKAQQRRLMKAMGM